MVLKDGTVNNPQFPDGSSSISKEKEEGMTDKEVMWICIKFFSCQIILAAVVLWLVFFMGPMPEEVAKIMAGGSRWVVGY